MSGRLLPGWPVAEPARPLLLCLPPAGAGCGQFRQWQRRLEPDLAVAGVQLPGREERWSDPPATSVDEVVGEVVGALTGRPVGAPLLLFGYSFGGLLAYEIARRLGEEHGRWPVVLGVAACRPPQMWQGRPRSLFEDEQELDRMLAAGGIDPQTLDDENRQVLLAPLRHDTVLSRTYHHRGNRRLRCPVRVWGGTDDHTVTVSQLDGWREYTVAGFSRRLFDGDHYFLHHHLDQLLEELRGFGSPAPRAQTGAI